MSRPRRALGHLVGLSRVAAVALLVGGLLSIKVAYVVLRDVADG